MLMQAEILDLVWTAEFWNAVAALIAGGALWIAVKNADRSSEDQRKAANVQIKALLLVIADAARQGRLALFGDIVASFEVHKARFARYAQSLVKLDEFRIPNAEALVAYRSALLAIEALERFQDEAASGFTQSTIPSRIYLTVRQIEDQVALLEDQVGERPDALTNIRSVQSKLQRMIQSAAPTILAGSSGGPEAQRFASLAADELRALALLTADVPLRDIEQFGMAEKLAAMLHDALMLKSAIGQSYRLEVSNTLIGDAFVKAANDLAYAVGSHDRQRHPS